MSTVVLISGDSDMVPGIRFARREGLRAYLHALGHRQIRNDFIEYAGIVL